MGRHEERSAIEHVADTIQTALNVLGVAKVSASGPDDSGAYALICNRDDGIIKGNMRLRVRLTLDVISESGELRARTLTYHHTLWRRERDEEIEVLSYHWPGHGHEPHVHVHGGKEHIGTGRIPVETIIRYCIRDEHWQPTRSNWEDVLKVTESHFEWNRHWQ